MRFRREGGGAQMVVGKLLRLCGHGEHDDAAYVVPELKGSHLGRDCLDVAVAQVLELGVMTEGEVEALRSEAADRVQEAVAVAQKDPKPDPYQEDWRAVSEAGMQA